MHKFIDMSLKLKVKLTSKISNYTILINSVANKDMLKINIKTFTIISNLRDLQKDDRPTIFQTKLVIKTF